MDHGWWTASGSYLYSIVSSHCPLGGHRAAAIGRLWVRESVLCNSVFTISVTKLWLQNNKHKVVPISLRFNHDLFKNNVIIIIVLYPVYYSVFNDCLFVYYEL